MFLHIRCWLLVIASLATQQVFALNGDRQEKLVLNSATAQLNTQTGISTYQGNVKVDQGTTHLLADTLIVHTDQHNKLRQLTAIGKPAHYQTLPQENKPMFHADADNIEYYPQKNLIILIGNAKAYQNHDVYTGPRIEYDTVAQTVRSPKSREGRTTITIQQKPSAPNSINKEPK